MRCDFSCPLKLPAFLSLLSFITLLFWTINASAELPSQSVPDPVVLLGLPKSHSPVSVTASFFLHDIEEIDDVAETFQFSGTLTLSWKDERQAFDPAKVGVHEKIYQGDYQFNELSPAWYPQVVLANESGLFEKNGTILRIQPDGTSTLIETVNAIAEADLSMRRYPFDRQQLRAVFQVLGFDSQQVIFRLSPNDIGEHGDSIQLSQWTVEQVGLETSEQRAPYLGHDSVASTFVVTAQVKRNSLFMLRLVLIPLFLIVMLSWSVFWMDRSALADRVNISFIGILTAVTYQIVVSDIIPHQSYVTFMNAFLNISLVMMCATVVMNLVVGEYDKANQRQTGDRIDFRCRRIFPTVYLLSLAVAALFIFLLF